MSETPQIPPYTEMLWPTLLAVREIASCAGPEAGETGAKSRKAREIVKAEGRTILTVCPL